MTLATKLKAAEAKLHRFEEEEMRLAATLSAKGVTAHAQATH